MKCVFGQRHEILKTPPIPSHGGVCICALLYQTVFPLLKLEPYSADNKRLLSIRDIQNSRRLFHL